MQQRFSHQELEKLLFVSEDSSYAENKSQCLTLLNNSQQTTDYKALNQQLETLLWHYTNQLVLLAISHPDLLAHCQNNPDCQKLWENYLNSVLKSNKNAGTISPMAHQNLFDTLIGTYLTLQASNHTNANGQLTAPGISLINQAMHYHSVFAATMLLKQIILSADVNYIATQLPKFKDLITHHGAAGCQLAVIAYAVFADKNISNDDQERAQTALQQALCCSYMAELLRDECKDDLANYHLVQYQADFNPGSFEATTDALSKQFGNVLNQQLINSAKLEGDGRVSRWKSAHLNNQQEAGTRKRR